MLTPKGAGGMGRSPLNNKLNRADAGYRLPRLIADHERGTRCEHLLVLFRVEREVLQRLALMSINAQDGPFRTGSSSRDLQAAAATGDRRELDTAAPEEGQQCLRRLQRLPAINAASRA